MIQLSYQHIGVIHIQEAYLPCRCAGGSSPYEGRRNRCRDCIQLRHRSHLWMILSTGILMTSLLRRGTAWEATLVKAITADYPPIFYIGPLPDSLTTLLLAQYDPNITGNPSLSPLGTAIRRGEERTVEVLLQFQADPHLKEEREELPLIIAIARRATNCVKILLDYRADPRTTMSAPMPGPHGVKASHNRHATAMEIAASHPASPEIVALLLTAMERDYSTVSTNMDNESSITTTTADATFVLASPPHREVFRVRYPGSRAESEVSCCGSYSAQTTSRANDSTR